MTSFCITPVFADILGEKTEKKKKKITSTRKQKNMIVKDFVRYLSTAHQSTITKKDAMRKYSGIKL